MNFCLESKSTVLVGKISIDFGGFASNTLSNSKVFCCVDEDYLHIHQVVLKLSNFVLFRNANINDTYFHLKQGN